jgi:ketol-acid reductoisomerase
VLVENDIIAYRGPDRPQADRVISGAGKMLIPGLVQTHVHLPQAIFRGQADDKELLTWRQETAETAFEKTINSPQPISDQEFFDHGTLMVALVKAGVELAYETMTATGIVAESAYYESLHEAPLIANTIARKKLYEMNRIISDTAEYGCYLFDHACKPLLADFMKKIEINVIGRPMTTNFQVDNVELINVNKAIREHEIEVVGAWLREAMTDMKKLN